MLILLACVYFLCRYGTIGIGGPLPETTIPLVDRRLFSRDESSDACSDRSVWNIIWSCLATTFAVTWVSVHPNVPFLGEGDWTILRRRTFLMILALVAPEVMILWAFKQWRGAIAIKDIINNACPDQQKCWTMAHAHFLQMGGIRLMCTKEENQEGSIYSSLCERVDIGRRRIVSAGYFYLPYYAAFQSGQDSRFVEGTLTFEALRALLGSRRIDFPSIALEEIRDKSKSDALSKGFALLQISWFIIQLFARIRQHLAITEIELTTAALAGLNSIMYLCWWSKPLDVRCPIVIKTKTVERMMVENEENKENTWCFDDSDSQNFNLVAYILSEISSHWSHSITLMRQIICALWPDFRGVLRAIYTIIQRIPENVAKSMHEIADGDKPDILRSTFRLWMSIVNLPIYLLRLLMFLPINAVLDHAASRSIVNDDHSVKNEFYLEDYQDAKEKMQAKTSLKLLIDDADMKWIMFMIFNSEKATARPLFYFSAFAGIAFGAIHCAAWNFTFPSVIEQDVWRVTSLLIIGLCFLVIASVHLHEFARRRFWLAEPGLDESKMSLKVMFYIRRLSVVPCVLFPLARISLLLIAVLSLRDLPHSALESVQWTKFIPHI